MPQAAEIAESLKGAGIVGVSLIGGAHVGTSWKDWQPLWQQDVGMIGILLVGLAALWIVLIFLGRMSGLEWLRRLDGASQP